MSMTDPLVVAIDLGGSGTRLVAEGAADGRPVASVSGPPRAASTGVSDDAVADGLTHLATRLVEQLDQRRPEIVGVVAGVAGLSSLVKDPVWVRDRLASAFAARDALLASDMVTAHVGALGYAPGAVLAAGTGAVALGTDLDRVWRRVDGWGHLLGDLGSGAWIGMEGLRAAARGLDGRAAPSALSRAAEARFGPVATWPGQVYPRTDRPRVLGEFAPDVAAAAEEGDETARDILRRAAAHLADTLTGAIGDGVPPRIALTGGLFGMPPALLRDPVLAALRARHPGLEVAERPGRPLDGAVLLARRLAAGRPVPRVAPFAC
ncbi:N-acetylglucosamine kinase [Microbacterium sediminis]|uniref:ATPase BadF/BadG/BcrA/BcrD type domain-containing protein n=1 Tax=Microbacterium sediminis TaxID=904291 RepID=A0A1B9NIY8_9MICO|nr:BadF/BadG/BcrA/BcrD ATPase family protein [Microbacterium sediminis]OCG76530.1 hypothetical protein A7J15_11130 [Microbacterium sediminis]